MVELSFFF